MAGFALREDVFLVRFADVVEDVAAAARVDGGAVLGGALDAEDVGGWGRGVYDDVGGV